MINNRMWRSGGDEVPWGGEGGRGGEGEGLFTQGGACITIEPKVCIKMKKESVFDSFEF